MKKLATPLMVLAAISALVWIICRLTGSLLPASISVKGLYHFVVVCLLFAIAISIREQK